MMSPRLIPWRAHSIAPSHIPLTHHPVATIMKLLNDKQEACLIVGGAVRHLLKDEPLADIDLATTHEPQEVEALLARASIESRPTGIEHGTITAIHENHAFEITTLRKDIETDGRHATVTYSRDWNDDWQRRDFTFNALYANLKGDVYDPSQRGIDDLQNGIVRFIGDPMTRLKEDYLRLLRFFRFHAFHQCPPPEPELLSVLREARVGLKKVSGERLWREFKQILALPKPLAALELMSENDILQSLELIHAPKTIRDLEQHMDYYNLMSRKGILQSLQLIHAPSTIRDLKRHMTHDDIVLLSRFALLIHDVNCLPAVHNRFRLDKKTRKWLEILMKTTLTENR